MGKTEKEGRLVQIRLNEIEFITRSFIGLSYRVLVILGAGFAFLYVNKIYIVTDWNRFLSSVLIILLLLWWYDYQMGRYISYCYDSLFCAVKDKKISGYEIPKFRLFNYLWYFKKKKA